MKIKAKVHVVYNVEINVDDDSNVTDNILDEWYSILDTGQEDKHFNDTVVESWEIIE